LEKGERTRKDPGGIVDQQQAEGFGVVGFEALDDELHGVVFHVSEREACHIEEDGLQQLVNA
jgi:hypothetical protein